MTKKRTVQTRTRQQLIDALRALMNDGHSNKSAGEVLGISADAVAGIRHVHKIPSKNRPVYESASKKARPKLEYATSEAMQCVQRLDDDKQCGWKREPGSQYCALPEHKDDTL